MPEVTRRNILRGGLLAATAVFTSKVFGDAPAARAAADGFAVAYNHLDITPQVGKGWGSLWMGGYGWGPYWSGYGGWYSTVYSPGYLVNTTIVRLQTRLWAAEGEGKPVWTGVSESVDPSNVKSVSNEIAYMVTGELDKHGLI